MVPISNENPIQMKYAFPHMVGSKSIDVVDNWVNSDNLCPSLKTCVP